MHGCMRAYRPTTPRPLPVAALYSPPTHQPLLSARLLLCLCLKAALCRMVFFFLRPALEWWQFRPCMKICKHVNSLLAQATLLGGSNRITYGPANIVLNKCGNEIKTKERIGGGAAGGARGARGGAAGAAGPKWGRASICCVRASIHVEQPGGGGHPGTRALRGGMHAAWAKEEPAQRAGQGALAAVCQLGQPTAHTVSGGKWWRCRPLETRGRAGGRVAACQPASCRPPHAQQVVGAAADQPSAAPLSSPPVRSSGTSGTVQCCTASVAARELELLGKLALGQLLGSCPQLLFPLGLLLPQLLLIQLTVVLPGALCSNQRQYAVPQAVQSVG